MNQGFLASVASDIRRIMSIDFGQDITITPTMGGPVTVKGYTGKHSINIDENGFLKVNSQNAHITVPEKFLLDAGLITRDTNGRLITFAGYLIEWTDVSGLTKKYIVQKGGSRTDETIGIISLVLGDYANANPGRVIYGWRQYPVSASIVASLPSPVPMQTLGNGDQIPAVYVLNSDGTLTIPYLLTVPGMQVLTPLMVNNDEYQDIADVYNPATATFDASNIRGGFGLGNNVAFNASLPIWSLL